MTEDLLKQISEIVEGDSKTQSERAPINIVVGNGSTVVIGNGSISQGGKEVEDEGGDGCCPQHGACAEGHRRELLSLRHEVRMLKRLLTARRAVRIPSVTKRPACPVRQNVANHKRASLLMPPRAKSPVTAGFNSPRPTSTHINPDISDLMSPHSG